MPCLYFEPREPCADPAYPNARLPLLAEFDGVCWLSGQATAVGAEVRLLGCNHGNIQKVCGPLAEAGNAAEEPRLRFSVAERAPEFLSVSVIEEVSFAPRSSMTVRYFPATGETVPRLAGCGHSQLVAFCTTYLRRYPLKSND